MRGVDVAVEGVQGVGELVEALAGDFEDTDVVFGEGDHAFVKIRLESGGWELVMWAGFGYLVGVVVNCS